MGAFQLRKKLLPVKLHYFLINGGNSGVLPFLPVYAQQLGLTSSTIGVIYAIATFLSVVSRALFGRVADHLNRLKTVLIVLLVIHIAADLGLNFMPRPDQHIETFSNANLTCSEGTSYLITYNESLCGMRVLNRSTDCYTCSICQFKSKYCSTNHSINPVNERLNKELYLVVTSLNCIEDNTANCNEGCYRDINECKTTIEQNAPTQLWMLSIFIGIVYVAFGSIVSLCDAACFNALENHPERFGQQRMWGAISWGLFAIVSGYLNKSLTETKQNYNFSAGFYMLVLLFALDIPVVAKLSLKDVRLSKNIFKDLTHIMTPRVALLFSAIFFIGAATGFSRHYLFLYFKTDLDANPLLLGLATSTQCFLGELPFFYFSGKIIEKLGHINTFTTSFIAYGVRFLIVSYLTNPWAALPTEILQGPCFGSFYSAMTSYAKIIAPEGTEATVQGIVSGIFDGIGMAIGTLAGGFAFDAYGNRETFFWAGVFFLVVGIIHAAIYAFINYRSRDSRDISLFQRHFLYDASSREVSPDNNG